MLAERRLLELLKDEKYRTLCRAFAVWLGRVVIKRAGIQEDVTGIRELEEMNAMLEENVVHWKDRYIQQGRVAGLAEGRVAGLAEGREAGLAEGRVAGLAEGRIEERREIVARMLRNNVTKSQIAMFLCLTDAELEELIAQSSSN